jgi:hypothetical protein
VLPDKLSNRLIFKTKGNIHTYEKEKTKIYDIFAQIILKILNLYLKNIKIINFKKRTKLKK